MASKPPNHRKKWTRNDVQELRNKARKGIDTPNIAKNLGRTESAVRTKASEENISLKPLDK